MGDGGGCHPRDNIAMSWLARELRLGHDWFESIMLSRQEQARWLCKELMSYNLPIAILGYAFKPETNIGTGSHALLVKSLLVEQYFIEPVVWDPYIDNDETNLVVMTNSPHVILIGVNHQQFIEYTFCPGSVVIDPFRYISDQLGVEIIRLGELK